MPELRLLGQLHEDAQRQVAQPTVLHVDVDVRAVRARHFQDWPQAPLHCGGAALGIGRLEPGMQRGELHRDIHARQRAPGRRVQARRRRPVPRLAAQRLDELDITRLVGVGLDVAQARLAEQVECERLAGAPGVQRRAAGLGRRAAGDEAARETAHRLSQHDADHRITDAAGDPRDAERRVQQAGVRRVAPLEVLAQVPHEIAIGVEGRQHVDEAEELQLGVLVRERPCEERRRPAIGGIERLTVDSDSLEQLTADLLHARFVRANAHGHPTSHLNPATPTRRRTQPSRVLRRSGRRPR